MPPEQFTEAPFTGPADLVPLRAMLMQARAAGAPGCWHVGDLVWRYFLMTLRADPARDIGLWRDRRSGELAGYAWLDPSDASCDWQVRPASRWHGLEDEMLAWVEARLADYTRAGGSGEPRGLLTGAFADDERRAAFLESRGFRRQTSGYVHFERSLAEPIPPATVPPGFVVRPVAGPHEAARRASAHRDAFAPSRVTDEAYPRLMGLPGYNRDLDVVAVAPDGDFAAFSLAWLDEVNATAEFEPVGTRASYRRLGLARAVQLEGLRRMRAAGAATAFVATWNDARPAIELYQSVGFKIVGGEADYYRPGPGAD
jgi:ribosomal protein S18 acetylase RimI-like enzyme